MEEYLARINSLSGVEARFMGRVNAVEVDHDRMATVKRLEPFHKGVVEEMGFTWDQCWRAEQVHGDKIAVVKSGEMAKVIEGVDGLISADAGVLLGIYVADCGAIYLVDQVTGVIGLLHSGKKGTEFGILQRALGLMRAEFGCKMENILVVLSPCIRPPAYEVDFASEIKKQAMEAGVRFENFTDCGICTSQDLEMYYSYRVEQGATGRMLALLGRRTDE
jgi:polyphenol oxidase